MSGGKRFYWDDEKDELLRSAYRIGRLNKKELTAALTQAQARIGFPRYMLKQRASALGITDDRRHPWSPQEIEFLRQYAGEKSVRWIATKLHRAYESVKSQLSAKRISFRPTVGYSREEFMGLLGVSGKSVTEWVTKGWLATDENNRITEKSAHRFLLDHPDAYKLARVDDAWFKGILFGRTMGKQPVYDAMYLRIAERASASSDTSHYGELLNL